jgi:hypothetical protein
VAKLIQIATELNSAAIGQLHIYCLDVKFIGSMDKTLGLPITRLVLSGTDHYRRDNLYQANTIGLSYVSLTCSYLSVMMDRQEL